MIMKGMRRGRQKSIIYWTRGPNRLILALVRSSCATWISCTIDGREHYFFLKRSVSVYHSIPVYQIMVPLIQDF